MIDLEKIRQETKEHIQNLGMSESSFARKVGVQQGSLWRFLSQGAGLSFEGVVSLLDELGYTLSRPESPPKSQSPNLPALSQSPDNISPSEAMEEIAKLKRDLEEKGRQLGELYQYKHRWEGLIEIKRTEETVRVQAQQQKSLLFSSDPSACAGREPEARELLGPGVHDPPEHDDPVRG